MYIVLRIPRLVTGTAFTVGSGYWEQRRSHAV